MGGRKTLCREKGPKRSRISEMAIERRFRRWNRKHRIICRTKRNMEEEEEDHSITKIREWCIQ